MTSRKRLLTGIYRQEPDTVPVCPCGLDVLTKIYGKPWNWQKRLQASMDLDFDHTDFFQIPMPPASSMRVSEGRRDFGEYELVTTTYETPKGTLIQREKRYRNRAGKHVTHHLTTVTVEEFLVKDRVDLEKLPIKAVEDIDFVLDLERVYQRPSLRQTERTRCKERNTRYWFGKKMPRK